jgi:hypothetical protein
LKSYDHGLPLSDFQHAAYDGAVYDPVQQRIYFTPRYQTNPSNFKPYWHYLDCASGRVVRYSHGLTASDLQNGAYAGGAYDPIQKRIYFAPLNQTNSTNFKPNWHYIDCVSGQVVSYAHNLSSSDLNSYAYGSAVFSSTAKRVYFVPGQQINLDNFKPDWHYIDCVSGEVKSYSNNLNVSEINFFAYGGGIYSPLTDKIYLVPFLQSRSSNFKEHWHYINCSNGNVESYLHHLNLSDFQDSPAYNRGVYDPFADRIYFAPFGGTNVWHYLDCQKEQVFVYSPQLEILNSAYISGVFDPYQNRVYFIPYAQVNAGNFKEYWHGIQNFSPSRLTRQLASHTSLNYY